VKMVEKRVKCLACGERFSYTRMGAGRPPVRCEVCQEARKVEQTRARVQALRVRRGLVGS
jgi:hypothetical protein